LKVEKVENKRSRTDIESQKAPGQSLNPRMDKQWKQKKKFQVHDEPEKTIEKRRKLKVEKVENRRSWTDTESQKAPGNQDKVQTSRWIKDRKEENKEEKWKLQR